jgi:menaquinol-cytochrome c reductase iron-sulfur subunit
MTHAPEPHPTAPLLGRRSFLNWLTYGIGAIAAVLVGVPFIGYLLGARKAPIYWHRLGTVEDFPLEQTRLVTFDNPIRQPWDGVVAHTGVYVRYQGQNENKEHRFLVLSVNCAHLGCPVEWFQESGLFMCPCHGGVYHADGERASGPPPRGLFQVEYRVSREGGLDHLEIQAPHYPTLQDTLRHEG